jgi:hypothetical protein
MFALGSGIDNPLNLNVFPSSILDASNKHEVFKKAKFVAGQSACLRAEVSSRRLMHFHEHE